jgi:hypothetical protein
MSRRATAATFPVFHDFVLLADGHDREDSPAGEGFLPYGTGR